jgi:hypothetical protein
LGRLHVSRADGAVTGSAAQPRRFAVLALLASEPQIRRAVRHASKAVVTLGRHATCTGLHRIAMPPAP